MDKRLKILVIGCGVISRHWFAYTAARNDCEIIGVVDISAEAAKAKILEYGLDCPVFTDINTALAALKPDIAYDLSYVTTHREITTKCLLAGCNVFSEKPMTTDHESALDILNTARKCGKTYSVMQNRRYQRPVQMLRELAASGRLGNIWTICADIFVPADLKSIRNTLTFPMLQDNAIHTFDGIRFISGIEPEYVYCHSYHPVGSPYCGDAAGVCLFEMSDGSVCIYDCVMGTEGCHTSWESSWRIIGSNGSAIWDGFGMPYAEIRNEQGTGYDRMELTTAWNGQEQHFGCLNEMFAAFLAGKPSQTDGTDNLKSISMVFASLESAKTGQRIKISDYSEV